MAARPSGQVRNTQMAARKTEQQHQARRAIVVKSSEGGAPADPLAGQDEPESCKDAIALGLRYTGAARWTEALPIFEKAMSLPGTGMKRYRDKPRQPSDSEKMTCLYNIACCHAQLGDAKSGLVALAGALELGYADFPQIRRDTDLAALRKDERFEGLMRRFEPQGGLGMGFNLGGLFGGKK
eukprot:CAMPEP_0202865976 /NCGR_PEP_ID=MMETSP1391-20130828/6854_1 /ASSEMBLY_ACC=CAM_ASM_000867 /TAXON_ID=1034604 /ORGANISM="Chlamydomonas leiostraca, Strain SAG 11-49" /LENGTH=181 /DNA_ID=CAMNT_0049545869 /DNA_START=120 /DNA_END=665 /DNA_ORIENTATION=+